MLHLDRLCYQLNEFSLMADLQIAAGDRVAVIGPSGGGKSTLLNGIAGFLVPRAGQMFWGGQPMPDHPGEGRSVFCFKIIIFFLISLCWTTWRSACDPTCVCL